MKFVKKIPQKNDASFSQIFLHYLFIEHGLVSDADYTDHM